MAEDPSDLTHRLLRDIRSAQEEQGAKLDDLTKEVSELRGWVVHALGVVTTENLKNSGAGLPHR